MQWLRCRLDRQSHSITALLFSIRTHSRTHTHIHVLSPETLHICTHTPILSLYLLTHTHAHTDHFSLSLFFSLSLSLSLSPHTHLNTHTQLRCRRCGHSSRHPRSTVLPRRQQDPGPVTDQILRAGRGRRLSVGGPLCAGRCSPWTLDSRFIGVILFTVTFLHVLSISISLTLTT